ncbi:MAG: hypothetical protein Q8N55_00720 [bacterium]|nr:hypothetical protein [bacterium]
MPEENPNYLAMIGGYILVSAAVITSILTTHLICPEHHFPATKKVQRGSAVLSELEIAIRDSNAPGEKEAVILYKGLPYRLRDADGTLVIQTGEVDYPKTIPKNKF